MKRKYIAVCGFARSGKDSSCKILKEEIQNIFPDKKIKIYSFAFHLRKELEDFIQTNFGISVWTENTEEKNIIRPILIAYGNAKRKQSKNKYWIQKLEKDINIPDRDENPVEIVIISDLRFSETIDDELGWFKSKEGFLIFLERTNKEKKELAPNEFEEKNSPILEKESDAKISLKRFKNKLEFEKKLRSKLRLILEDNLDKLV